MKKLKELSKFYLFYNNVSIKNGVVKNISHKKIRIKEEQYIELQKKSFNMEFAQEKDVFSYVAQKNIINGKWVETESFFIK